MPSKEAKHNKIFSLVLMSGAFFLGFGLAFLIIKSSPKLVKEIRNPEGYRFISPLLECDGDGTSSDHNLLKIKKSINNVVNKKDPDISLISVYYRDLNNGPWFGINEDELFSPASLLKVPMLITYLHKSEHEPEILQSTFVYEDLPDLDQNILPEQTLAQGQSYTIEDLLVRMILYSDNAAGALLSSKVDYAGFMHLFDYMGIDISASSPDDYGNIISVKEYAAFFRILYNASYLNKEMSEKALELLSRVEYAEGLVAGLPPDVMVSHKFGERTYNSGEKQLHDCGIVYAPGHPYLLCLMTRGTNFGSLSKVIREISSVTYQNTINN